MKWMALLTMALLAGTPVWADENIASEYGFEGIEIYKVDFGIENLVFDDVNNDGRSDFGFINNARSRIELFVRLEEGAPDELEVADPDNVNEVTYDGRFKKEYLPVEQEVVGLALGDFNSDELLDAAMITRNGDLLLRMRDADEQIFRIQNFEPVRQQLLSIDLNNDGLHDLVALGKKKTLIWQQSRDDTWFKKPSTLYNLDHEPGGLKIGDLNGDGLPDLIYLYFQGEYPVHIRLQTAPGLFSPVVAERMEGMRAYEADDVDRDGKSDLLLVYRESGRLALLSLEETEKPVLLNFPLRGADEKGNVSYTTADLDGNGASEIVVADAGAARVMVFSGLDGQGGWTSDAFPSLRGACFPRVADLDGNGAKSLVVVSPQEKVIGLTPAQLKPGFPRFVAVDGEPAAMDTGDVDGDGNDDVVCLTTKGTGSKKEYLLNILYSAKEGEKAKSSVLQKAKPKKKVITGKVQNIMLTDVNHDGKDDLVVFMSKEVPAVFFNAGGAFEFGMGGDAPGLGILEGAEDWTVCPADTDGDGFDELAVCNGNLVRFIYIPEGADVPQAMRQYNSDEPEHQFKGCAFGDTCGDDKPELLVYESSSRQLLVLDHEDTPVMRFDLARYDFRGVDTAELNGDGKKDIIVKGKNRIGVWLSGRQSQVLQERTTYESKDKKSYFVDVAAGDVNANGAVDAVLIDSGQSSLFIVALRDGAFQHAMKFKVFEEKLFRRNQATVEPHTIKVSELTGDGKQDLIILVHDKVIVYPQ